MKIPKRDELVLQLFIVSVTCASITFGLVYAEYQIAILGLLTFLLIANLTGDDYHEFYKPMPHINNPILESGIVLLIFINWALFISPLISYQESLVLSIGTIVFGLVIPLIFLSRYRRNNRLTLGLSKKGLKAGWRLTGLICIALVIGVSVRLLNVENIAGMILNYDALLIIFSMSIYYGVVISLSEEFVFRGVLQTRFSVWLRSRVAGMIIASSIFAVLHVFTELSSGAGYGTISIVYFILRAFLTRLPLGVIMGIVWNKTENLSQPFSIHATNNILFSILFVVGLI